MYAYTEEQAKQAIADKKYKDCIKGFELILHERARIERIEYNIPYRILFDYYHRDRDPFEIPINYYYPFPGKEKACTNAPTDTETDYDFSSLIDNDSNIGADTDTDTELCCIYDLTTEQGQQAWLYWFAVYILPYEDTIPTFTAFDMYGDTEHTEAELNEHKQYYMDLISRCKRDPELYNHDIPRKHITDYDTYDVGECYLWQDPISKAPTPPNTDHDTALAIMYKEREIQQNYYGDMYIGECMDRYSRVYRIEALIKELETGEVDKDIQRKREEQQNKHPLRDKLCLYAEICDPFMLI